MSDFGVPGQFILFNSDPIEGTNLDDILAGTSGSEHIKGHGGNDTLRGNE